MTPSCAWACSSLRLGHVVGGLAAIELGGADELLFVQVAEAFELVLGLGEVRARGGELGIGRFDVELVVAGIEPGQQLAARDLRADLDIALDDLSRHAEAQRRLVARAHVAGVGRLRPAAIQLDLHDMHRAHILDRRRFLGAGRQAYGHPRQHGKPKQVVFGWHGWNYPRAPRVARDQARASFAAAGSSTRSPAIRPFSNRSIWCSM